MRHRSTMACDTDVAVVTDDIAGGIYAYGVRWVYTVRVINFHLNIFGTRQMENSSEQGSSLFHNMNSATLNSFDKA